MEWPTLKFCGEKPICVDEKLPIYHGCMDIAANGLHMFHRNSAFWQRCSVATVHYFCQKNSWPLINRFSSRMRKVLWDVVGEEHLLLCPCKFWKISYIPHFERQNVQFLWGASLTREGKHFLKDLNTEETTKIQVLSLRVGIVGIKSESSEHNPWVWEQQFQLKSLEQIIQNNVFLWV